MVFFADFPITAIVTSNMTFYLLFFIDFEIKSSQARLCDTKQNWQ